MKSTPFTFTLTDLARFLGKAPATVRQWEKNGLVELSRNGTDRRVTADEIKMVAKIAHLNKRITLQRLRLVSSTVTLLNLIEGENDSN